MSVYSENIDHRSAIQQALSQPDILPLIFEQTHSFSNLDLRSCALVDSRFSEHALKLLWRTLRSSLPLWNLFAERSYTPPDETKGLLRQEIVPDHAARFLLERAPLTNRARARLERTAAVVEAHLTTVIAAERYQDLATWQRFLDYCSYVHHLSMRFLHQGCDLKNDILLRIALAKNGNRTIFPQLQLLDWSPMFQSINSLPPLCSRGLRAVCLRYDHYDSHEALPAQYWLDKLLVTSPDLEEIKVYVHDFVDFLNTQCLCRPELIHAISLFGHLREVVLSYCIGPASLRQLLAIPTLETVHVGSVTPRYDSNVLNLPVIFAKRLRELRIEGVCSAVTYTLARIRTPVLESLYLEFPDRGGLSMDYNPAIFKVVADMVPHDRPLTISIHISESMDSPNNDGYLDLSDVLKPLFDVRHIVSFHLLMEEVSWFIEGADFVAMARAWPELELLNLELYMVYSYLRRIPSAVPVLSSFWRHCPNLKSLKLPLLDPHFVAVTDFPMLKGGGASTHCLSALSIDFIHSGYPEDAPIERFAGLAGVIWKADELRALARYIHRLFPLLEPTVVGLHPNTAYGDSIAWHTVFHHLRALRGQ